MNIEKLIEAAQEIKRLRDIQKERAQSWRQLAQDARNGEERRIINIRKMALESKGVVDFSGAIDALCKAL